MALGRLTGLNPGIFRSKSAQLCDALGSAARGARGGARGGWPDGPEEVGASLPLGRSWRPENFGWPGTPKLPAGSTPLRFELGAIQLALTLRAQISAGSLERPLGRAELLKPQPVCSRPKGARIRHTMLPSWPPSLLLPQVKEPTGKAPGPSWEMCSPSQLRRLLAVSVSALGCRRKPRRATRRGRGEEMKRNQAEQRADLEWRRGRGYLQGQ